MKKNFLLKSFLTFILVQIFINTFSQSFSSGSLLISINTAIEAYNTEYKYQIKNTNFDTLIKDQAGNKNYFLALEYGLLKWFGLGIKGKINNYYTEKDKYTGVTPTANSFEIAVTARAHVIRTKHFDLPIGFSFGGSSLTYNTNDPYYPITITGKGTYFDIHIQPMVYFKRLGFNLYIGSPAVNYSDMTTNRDAINQLIITTWKGKGVILGIGLQYRILN
ncbi:MAG: hypothetical protein N2203_03415 [Bacteroidia bacterium]|nr:hypothetical protein [Bacteroidia bacterium]